MYARPGDARGGLGAASQALVRVHQWRQDGRHAARVRQLPGNELPARSRQLVALRRIEERITPVIGLDEHLRDVQPGPRRALERLGHEADQHASTPPE